MDSIQEVKKKINTKKANTKRVNTEKLNKKTKEQKRIFGASQYAKCLKIKQNEKVIIIYDISSKKYANYVIEQTKLVSKNTYSFEIENLGKRPIEKINIENIEYKQFLKYLKTFKVVICLITKVSTNNKDETLLRKEIKEFCYTNKIRYAITISPKIEILEQGMSVNYKKVKEIGIRIEKILKKSKTLTIKTKEGCKIIADIKKMKWINSYGDLRKQSHSCNLPSGEIYGYPNTVNGIFICNGEMGGNLIKYGQLKSQVIMQIQNGIITNVFCKNKKILFDIKKELEKDNNANRIGEIAIGFNIGLKQFINSIIQDEKFPGFHMAFGCPCSGTSDKYKSIVHIDMILKNPTIITENKIIMKEGKFLIQTKK